jgi:hypothetical protein
MNPNPGIRRLHSTGCPAALKPPGRCRCNAGWEASVWDRASKSKLRETFPDVDAARS